VDVEPTLVRVAVEHLLDGEPRRVDTLSAPAYATCSS